MATFNVKMNEYRTNKLVPAVKPEDAQPAMVSAPGSSTAGMGTHDASYGIGNLKNAAVYQLSAGQTLKLRQNLLGKRSRVGAVANDALAAAVEEVLQAEA